MSADNWTTCPRCAEENLKTAGLPYAMEPTFREDYEFYGAEDGVLNIHYRGRCTVCNLECSIDEQREFYI